MSDGIVWVYMKGHALNFTALKATIIIEYGKENETLGRGSHSLFMQVTENNNRCKRHREVGPCNKEKKKVTN